MFKKIKYAENFENKKGEHDAHLFKFVEMPGVEPGSENKTIKTSTFIVRVWDSVTNSIANIAAGYLHLKLSHRSAQVNLAASSKVWRLFTFQMSGGGGKRRAAYLLSS